MWFTCKEDNVWFARHCYSPKKHVKKKKKNLYIYLSILTNQVFNQVF